MRRSFAPDKSINKQQQHSTLNCCNDEKIELEPSNVEKKEVEEEDDDGDDDSPLHWQLLLLLLFTLN